MFFEKNEGVSAQYELEESERRRIGGKSGVHRQRGEGLLSELWESGGTQSGRQTEKVLLHQMPERLEVEPSKARELEVCADCYLPGVREAVYRQPRVWESTEVLQSCLRQ